ncbi:MAG TPA: outer membrane beta-barrel protein [Myxococcota bacterium]|nr:outer membrane beta-barrel protein [Myxococcota bacterium]
MCAAAGALLVPQLATAAEADVQAQLKQMQERMGQLEDRLQATTDQLEATQKKANEQQQLIEKSGLANTSGASGLAAFLETLEVAGHVSTSYNYNFNRPDGYTPLVNANGIRPFQGDSNSFALDQLNFALSRSVSPDQRAGFVTSIYYGETARVLNQIVDGCHGSTLVFDTAGCDSGYGNQVHVSNAYVQYLIPGAEVKAQAGIWQTLLGAEVIDDNANFNISRSLLFNALPFEHVGILLSKKYESGIDWAAGVVNGFDQSNGADVNKSKSYIGRIGYTQEKWALGVNGYWGTEQQAVENQHTSIVDAVLNLTPTSDLKAYVESTFIWSQFGSAPNDFYYGFAAAARYALTERLGISLRGEWTKDRESEYFNPLLPDGTGAVAAGDGTKIWEATTTLDYALTDHLMARAEFRYDKANVTSSSFNGVFVSQGKPGAARDLQNNQETIAGQLIYTF